MNKYIIVIVIIVIVILGGYFLFTQPSISDQPNDEEISQPLVEQAPTVNENVIIYTDAGYLPNTLTIKSGETITFKNQSSSSMWPASAMHPTHRLYSGTSLDEHCPDTTNSTFDACTGILPSGVWSFRFDKTGIWQYHDHLSPNNYGTIVVE